MLMEKRQETRLAEIARAEKEIDGARERQGTLGTVKRDDVKVLLVLCDVVPRWRSNSILHCTM